MKFTRYLSGILLLMALSPSSMFADHATNDPARKDAEAKEFEKSYSDFVDQIRAIKEVADKNASTDKGIVKPGKASEFINLESLMKASTEIKDFRKKMNTWCSEGDANKFNSELAKKMDAFFEVLAKKTKMPAEGVEKPLKVNKEGENITSREMIEVDIAKWKNFILFIEKAMTTTAARMKKDDEQLAINSKFLEQIKSLQTELGIEISDEERSKYEPSEELGHKAIIEGLKLTDQNVCLFRKSTSSPTGPASTTTGTGTGTGTQTSPTTGTGTSTSTGTGTGTGAQRDGRGGVRLPGDGNEDPTTVAEGDTATPTDTQPGTDGGGEQVPPQLPDLSAIEDRLLQQDPRLAQLADELARLQEEAARARLEDDDDDEEQLQLPNIEGDKQGGSKTEAPPPAAPPISVPPITPPSDQGQAPKEEPTPEEGPEDQGFFPVGVGNPMSNSQPATVINTGEERRDDRPLPQTMDPMIAMLLKQGSADSEWRKFMGGLYPPYGQQPGYLNQVPAPGAMSPFANRLSTRSFGGGGRMPPVGAAAQIAGTGTATGGSQAATMANPKGRAQVIPAALQGRI